MVLTYLKAEPVVRIASGGASPGGSPNANVVVGGVGCGGSGGIPVFLVLSRIKWFYPLSLEPL
jgi:hypothetical protein